MKTKQFYVLLLLAFIGMSSANAQIGIGTTEPEPTAELDVTSPNNDKGFLLPRISTADRNGILNPAQGLIIFNTDTGCLDVFNGSFWYDTCTGNLSPAPNAFLTLANPTYQGVSPINSRGIGYNGEAVPAASTVTIQVTNNNATEAQNYALFAEDNSTGLIYTGIGTVAAGATINAVLTNNEVDIPGDFYGTITMTVFGASSTLVIEPRIDIKSIPASETEIVDVVYGGQTWMDRNLGARRAATSFNDVLSYGNYYQWGRPSDGHEIIVWNGDTESDGIGLFPTTNVLSNSDTPGHPNFITTNASPDDWRSNNNNNRWRTNNQGPCPTGYKVPNQGDWVTADETPLGSGNGTTGSDTTGWDNSFEAFDSPLKLPSAGERFKANGLVSITFAQSDYWSNGVDGPNGRALRANAISSEVSFRARAIGFTVRCIKN